MRNRNSHVRNGFIFSGAAVQAAASRRLYVLMIRRFARVHSETEMAVEVPDFGEEDGTS